MIMKALKILFVVILVAIAHGCIRNDGNIGPIWGLWRVTNIEVDGKSIENYFTCMENDVAGFTKRFAKKGDIVYFVVNYEKVSYLTAKGLLGEETDKKPYEKRAMEKIHQEKIKN